MLIGWSERVFSHPEPWRLVSDGQRERVANAQRTGMCAVARKFRTHFRAARRRPLPEPVAGEGVIWLPGTTAGGTVPASDAP
jgi:hypothetical protein